MSTLLDWAAHPLSVRLGTTLLHFLWQGAAVALGLGIALLLLQSHRPQARYAACIGAILTLALFPALTFVSLPPGTTHLSPGGTFASTKPVPKLTGNGTASTEQDAAMRVEAPASQAPSIPWAGWAGFFWIAGATAMTLRLLGGWLCVSQLRRAFVAEVDPAWSERLQYWSNRMQLRRRVRLLSSPLIESPIIVGWIRPLILLPVRALEELHPRQMETLLVHELCHAQRNDYVLNMLQCFIETLLFFHPAVWWTSHRARLEREFCCDEQTVGLFGDKTMYARALLHLEELRGEPLPEAAVAALRPGMLVRRITRLYQPKVPDIGQRDGLARRWPPRPASACSCSPSARPRARP